MSLPMVLNNIFIPLIYSSSVQPMPTMVSSICKQYQIHCFVSYPITIAASSIIVILHLYLTRHLFHIKPLYLPIATKITAIMAIAYIAV